MKQFVILMLILGIGTSVYAQGTVTKEVGDFNIVKVFDLIEVNLIQSDEQKVIITGRDAHEVKVINSDGKLKIRMELDKRFSGDDTFVQVYFKKLDIIDGNEGAEIIVNELLEQDVIELKTQEGARIRAGLKVDEVNLKAVTGGVLEVSGTAQSQNITVNTGGIYEGRTLETERAKVFVQAGGEVEVHASQKIDIKVRAGGDVYVYGDPQDVSQSKIFGGRIKFF